jgi:hypothetical protein
LTDVVPRLKEALHYCPFVMDSIHAGGYFVVVVSRIGVGE